MRYLRYTPVASGITHGTWEGHEVHGCCCGPCVDAWRDRGKELEQIVRSQP